MPGVSWLQDVPYPLDHVRQLGQASGAVRQLRLQHPHTLYHWEPERPTRGLERPRRELALALALVQAMDTGDGGYEARIKACVKLYAAGSGAPAEAARAAELLLRSRIVSGATDVETFWLAATIAHPLRALVGPNIADLAWRYLTHAPFDVDSLSALEFAKASRRHRYDERPRWPFELSTALMERPDQQELSITVLEAMVCAHLRAPSIEAAAAKLPAKGRFLTPLFQDVLLRLAGLYIDAELDTLYAREVARQAADLGDARAKRFIETRIFDLPYEEIARVVKARLKGESDDLDAIYRRALEGGQLQVARRLAEMELLLRYGDWKKGPIYPSLDSVISDLLARDGQVEDPRLYELLLRTGLLYSRTHHYTPAAQRLVRHLSENASFAAEAPVEAMSDELGAFIRACDPYNTLQEATRAMEEKIQALEGDAREVLVETRHWMADRFTLGRDVMARAADAIAAPLTGRQDLGDAIPIAAIAQRSLKAIHHMGPLLMDVPATRAEIAAQAGLPWSRVTEASPARLKAIAGRYARVDQLVAAGVGGAAGLLGGPWGAALDLVTLVGLSARTVGRVGLCYGITPGSPESLELLTGSLVVASSSPAGEGLIALLRHERETLSPGMVTAGALFGASLGPRIAPRASARLIALAARQMGFSLSERRLIQMMPVVGAVMGAGADYLFLRRVSEAAVYLGARGLLMGQGSR